MSTDQNQLVKLWARKLFQDVLFRDAQWQAEQQARFFIDTEFNGFGGDLISVALVGDDGREFYASLGCERPSEWVAEHVMPVIGIPPVSREQLKSNLRAFLEPYKAIHVVADWPEDIAHFCDLLITGPGQRIRTPALTMEVRRDLDADSQVPHNALEDARAIQRKARELGI